ncbi:MAG: hypothetical protein QXI84_08170 [Thermofilaceae archaeon]
MRKWLILALVAVALAAVLLLPHIHRAPERGVEPRGVRVYIGSVIRPAFYVAVVVDGRTVYRDEMRSFTSGGIDYLRNTLTTWRTYTLSSDPAGYPKGTRMIVGHSAGTSTSSLSRSYAWNDTHIWVIFTGTFTADTAITLKWVALQYVDYNNAWRTVTNDTLSVNVPAGSTYTIQIWLIWQDNGILTANWAKVFSAHIPYQFPVTESVVNTAGATGLYGIVSGPGYSWQAPYTSMDRTVRMYLACGTGSAAQSRNSYALANKVERYPVSVSQTGSGVSVAATVARDCTEVGLELDYYDFSAGTTRTVLVLRWVTNIPANTPVTFYILPPPGG